MRPGSILSIVTLLLMAAVPQPALACAACFGKSDSPLAQGMNMGIFSLLAIVLVVLSAFAAFAIFIARRSAAYNAQPSQSLAQPETAQTALIQK